MPVPNTIAWQLLTGVPTDGLAWNDPRAFAVLFYRRANSTAALLRLSSTEDKCK